MEIVLIRHGKPNIETSGKVSALDFGSWVSAYNMAGIDNKDQPTVSAIEKANSCAFTVCSNLPRSVESATLLKIVKPNLVSPEFRECEIPYGSWKHLKLSKSAWSVVFRLLQLAGYSNNAESYREIKKRSKKCSTQLIELAKNHGSVLFVGHGALNWFLHKHLVSMGWSGPEKSTKKHWEFGVYAYNEI